MLTSWNAKQLAFAYNITETCYHNYFNETDRKIVNELATYRLGKHGKRIKRRDYNTDQLHHIVFEVMKDLPEHYEFKEGTLIKIIQT